MVWEMTVSSFEGRIITVAYRISLMGYVTSTPMQYVLLYLRAT